MGTQSLINTLGLISQNFRVLVSNQDCRGLKADTRLTERESEPLCFSDSHYGNVISTLTDAKKNNFAD